MVFSTSRTAENVHFLYNEKEIETVTKFNYLGVTFTKDMADSLEAFPVSNLHQ
jgi:hypothetical protein